MALFRITESVTRAHVKLEANVPVYVKFVSAVYDAPENRARRAAKPVDPNDSAAVAAAAKLPPKLADVIEYAEGPDGKLMQRDGRIIVAAALQTVFEDEFPGDALIGECLRITALGKTTTRAGNQLNLFEVVKFELDESAIDDTSATKKGKGK